MIGLGALAGLLQGCTVGPKYVRPATTAPVTYKEAADWKPAEPGDETIKGAWWEIFQDPQLNSLEEQLTVSNQTLRAAQDRFREARAALRVSRSSRFPLLTVGASPARLRQSSNRGSRNSNAATNYSDFLLNADVSYEADLWGRVRRTVESSRAQAQASAADLESIRLSLHAELAADYFTLRGLEAEKRLFDSTVEAFEKAQQLAQNRFQGGITSKEDVELSTTQLEQTRAQDLDITVMRNEFVHAIALLVGQPASSFSLTAPPLAGAPPAIPPGLPSQLVERRPDIARAERLVRAANEQIGIARAAYFPLISLSAIGGFESGQFTSLLAGPSGLWSVGAAALETVFDAGRRRAVSDQAKATYDETVATYQQTVLSAFREVEDSLSDLRILEEEARTQDLAVAAAQRSLDQSNHRYKGGLDTYLTVITAQSIALANQRAAVDLLTRRMTASVRLVKALGGGWDASKLPPVD